MTQSPHRIHSSEAFDWRPNEAGLGWRTVTELPRARRVGLARIALEFAVIAACIFITCLAFALIGAAQSGAFR